MASNGANHVFVWLQDWFRDKSGGMDVGPDENYFEAGVIDSFQAIELVDDVEREFSIKFDHYDFQDRRFVTLNGLVELIQSRRESS